MTRWWISWATTPRITARPCSSATAACDAIDASSACSSSVNGVSRSQTSSPICRRFHRSGRRTAYAPARPSGQAMFPSSSTSAAPVARTAAIVVFTIASSDSSRYSDSGHGLGDPRQRLELVHAVLRLRVELRVLDRLRDLRRDRDEQVDLASVNVAGRSVRTLSAPSSRPSRATIGTARIDSYWSSGRFGNDLKRGSRCASPRSSPARAPLRPAPVIPSPGSHARRARHLLDVRPVRRAQDELVGVLVVEVDEAGVRLERVRDAARDQHEHLLEVERGVDGGDRLGQQAEMARGLVHVADLPVREVA